MSNIIYLVNCFKCGKPLTEDIVESNGTNVCDECYPANCPPRFTNDLRNSGKDKSGEVYYE